VFFEVPEKIKHEIASKSDLKEINLIGALEFDLNLEKEFQQETGKAISSKFYVAKKITMDCSKPNQSINLTINGLTQGDDLQITQKSLVDAKLVILGPDGKEITSKLSLNSTTDHVSFDLTRVSMNPQDQPIPSESLDDETLGREMIQSIYQEDNSSGELILVDQPFIVSKTTDLSELLISL
jgi:hypothetical protein